MLTKEGMTRAREALQRMPVPDINSSSRGSIVERRAGIARGMVFGSSGDGRLPNGGEEVTDQVMEQIIESNSQV